MDCIYIVIPAYNEEKNIETVVREWHDIVSGINSESRLLVIDDGSADGTLTKLNELHNILPQLIVKTKPNSGHGGTVLYGYLYAIEQGADFIFQTDSDGQTVSSEFWAFWEEREKYGAIIGHRKHREDGLLRIIVAKVLKLILKIMFRLDIADANTPFRLMQIDVLKRYIYQIPSDFNLSNIMLTVLLINGNEAVGFKEISFRPRQGGKNSINLRKISQIGLKAIIDFKKIREFI